jgi:DNA-binding transcriptional ArsR family regulator
VLRAPHTTTELARRLGVTPSAISQHLAPLRAAGLIGTEQLGRQRLHVTSALGAALLAAERAA